MFQALKALNKFSGIMPLFVVSTPIGNLQDITFRALEIIKLADVILCENTGNTNFLLKSHEIGGKKLMHYTDHTSENQFMSFLEAATVQNVVLVSDAGTPMIADPGYKIIKKAHEMDIKVITIPGASSLTAAISVSGIPSHNFVFLGFFEQGKIVQLKKALNDEISVVFFVPARDIVKVLDLTESTIKSSKISIARELTKIFEDVKTGSFEEVKAHYLVSQKLQGEAVLMISGQKTKNKQEAPEIGHILDHILTEKPFLRRMKINELSEVLKTYEADLKPFSKKEIYNTLTKSAILYQN